MAQEAFAAAEKEAITAPALREGREEAEALLGAIAAAHCNGSSPDWRALFGARRRVPLPTYAYQRQRCWLEARAKGDVAEAGLDRVRPHDARRAVGEAFEHGELVGPA